MLSTQAFTSLAHYSCIAAELTRRGLSMAVEPWTKYPMTRQLVARAQGMTGSQGSVLSTGTG